MFLINGTTKQKPQLSCDVILIKHVLHYLRFKSESQLSPCVLLITDIGAKAQRNTPQLPVQFAPNAFKRLYQPKHYGVGLMAPVPHPTAISVHSKRDNTSTVLIPSSEPQLIRLSLYCLSLLWINNPICRQNGACKHLDLIEVNKQTLEKQENAEHTGFAMLFHREAPTQRWRATGFLPACPDGICSKWKSERLLGLRATVRS